MAPGSHPRHAHPGTGIQMLLRPLLDKGPHPKRCMRSSPDKSFRHVHRGRPSDDDKVLHGFFPPGPTRRPPRSVRIILMPPAPWAPTASHLQLRSFVIGSAFVGTSTSVRTRQSKIPCLGLSSKLSFEGVLVTQRLS